MKNLNTLYAGCTAFILGWSGADEVYRDTVDLLVMAAQDYYTHLEQGNDSYAMLTLEASSTYVQCDLSSDELQEYVEVFELFLCQASDGLFDDFNWEAATWSETEEAA
jgi:hypothetical protein